jgi:hypothetical protein
MREWSFYYWPCEYLAGARQELPRTHDNLFVGGVS